MNSLTKTLLVGTILTATASSAIAQEPSLLQRIKGYFFPSETTSAEFNLPQQTTAETKTSITEQESAQKNPNAPTFDFSDKIIGDPSAPLKLLVFTSLTCPHCSGMHLNLLPMMEKEYVKTGRAQIILMDFPIDARAMTASLIARCLSGDAYFSFIDTLFAHQQQWAVAPNLQEALAPHVKLAGMNEKKMIACATDQVALKEMMRIRNFNAAQYKINGTPSMVIRFGKKSETLVGLPTMQAIDNAVQKLTNPNYVPSKTQTPAPHAH